MPVSVTCCTARHFHCRVKKAPGTCENRQKSQREQCLLFSKYFFAKPRFRKHRKNERVGSSVWWIPLHRSTQESVMHCNNGGTDDCPSSPLTSMIPSTLQRTEYGAPELGFLGEWSPGVEYLAPIRILERHSLSRGEGVVATSR